MRLNKVQKAEILAKLNDRVSGNRLAKDYGVAKSTISLLKKRKYDEMLQSNKRSGISNRPSSGSESDNASNQSSDASNGDETVEKVDDDEMEDDNDDYERIEQKSHALPMLTPKNKKMDDEILDLRAPIGYSDTITNLEYHAYNSYTNSYGYNDEIRIVIQNQDLYVLPHKSYLYIEGTVAVNAPAPTANDVNAAARIPPNFVNNAGAYLFDEIRYELNGFQIDSCKNVGITSTMKGYISYTPNDNVRMANAGWNKESNTQAVAGHINFCIPLKHIFGFAEDYQNILINAKHELILVRSRNDQNALVGENNISSITIDKIQWRMPHVTVADAQKLRLLKIVDKQLDVPLHYRTWELYEYPVLPRNDKQIWSVKASSQLNTPRYIVLGFQTNRNNRITADKSRFDHCQLNDLKVYLNSECYPYESLNVNFNNQQIAVLYDMYVRFQESYYHDRPACCAAPVLTLEEFRENAPLIVIDCSHQNEALKKSIIDIRIEFQTRENVPANTAAYCLIMHDNLVSYNPYSNIVSRSAGYDDH